MRTFGIGKRHRDVANPSQVVARSLFLWRYFVVDVSRTQGTRTLSSGLPPWLVWQTNVKAELRFGLCFVMAEVLH